MFVHIRNVVVYLFLYNWFVDFFICLKGQTCSKVFKNNLNPFLIEAKTKGNKIALYWILISVNFSSVVFKEINYISLLNCKKYKKSKNYAE